MIFLDYLLAENCGYVKARIFHSFIVILLEISIKVLAKFGNLSLPRGLFSLDVFTSKIPF